MSHFSSFISGPPPSSCVQLRAFFCTVSPPALSRREETYFLPSRVSASVLPVPALPLSRKTVSEGCDGRGIQKKRLRTELGIGGTQRGGERRAVRSLMARGRKFAKQQKKSKKTHSRLMFAIIIY